MTPKGQKRDQKERVSRTSLIIPEELLVRLKHAAVEERMDVSALLCRIAEEWLKRKGGRR